jgi:hypothetical protein
MTEPTTAELRAAYRSTRLWRVGVSFEYAQQHSAFMACLRGIAINQRRQAASNGNRAPIQPALI